MINQDLSVKYLVIGGGVSGLAFANFIKDKDYLILEKESELGGYCRTIYQDGYIWDYAGHFFHFATDEMRNFFNNRISSSELIYKNKSTKIFFKNLVIDFPFQANIHQLDKDDFIDCLYDLYFREKSKSDDEFHSFLDMLYAKFGISITEKFLKPYNEKLYACDLNQLDKDAMGRFFPYADIEQVIRNFKNKYNGSYNASFMYPKNGAKVFIDALSKDLESSRIIEGEFVVKVCSKSKIATTNLGRRIAYKFLINSSPLNKFLAMLEGGNYQNLVRELSWNKVLVFNLGFSKKSQFKDIHWAYIPDKNINFYRVGFYDNILDGDKLSMYVEIGLSSEQSFNVEKELLLTLENLRKLDIIDDSNQLVSYSVVLMDPAYVHIDSKLDVIKYKLKNQLENQQIFSIGRYGDWKYCSIEDSMIDALNVANKLNQI